MTCKSYYPAGISHFSLSGLIRVCFGGLFQELFCGWNFVLPVPKYIS